MAFLAEIVFVSDFVPQNRNQPSKIDPCAKFQPNRAKDKGARTSTLNGTENCLMTSYLPHSDDVNKILNSSENFFQSTILPSLRHKTNSRHSCVWSV